MSAWEPTFLQAIFGTELRKRLLSNKIVTLAETAHKSTYMVL